MISRVASNDQHYGNDRRKGKRSAEQYPDFMETTMNRSTSGLPEVQVPANHWKS